LSFTIVHVIKQHIDKFINRDFGYNMLISEKFEKIKNFFSIIKYKNIDAHHLFNICGLIIRIKYRNFKIEKRITTEHGLNQENREQKIIVSLTTFPERINLVYITINQLLTQTLKPDRLILWLAENQFENREKDLPDNLLKLKEYGLEIKWCEDLKSYKKLIPTLKEFKNDIIITYDDDIYYPKDSVEKLYMAYLEDKNCICTHRNTRAYFKNGELKFFKARHLFFDKTARIKPSFFNIIIGCGGVLYPPNSLHSDILNIEKFKKLIPTQDDAWFWAMAVLNKTKIKVVDGFDTNLFTIENSQQYGLCKINNNSGQGMYTQDALAIMIKEYPVILEYLKEEA